MNDNGHIYILQNEFTKNVFKVGKTTNIKNTYNTYSRVGNIKMTDFYTSNYLSYIESMILNILGPYRTVREDKIKISEQVQLPFELINIIVGYVVSRVTKYGSETKISTCRSVKTLKNYRMNIPKSIWHDLCSTLDYNFPGVIKVPMETGDLCKNDFIMTYRTFDKFINDIKMNF